MSEHPETHTEPSAPVFRKWIGIIGLFVAPTTVISALGYYFGYFYTKRYFAYFGIESNALGFTTSDYVLRSVRPLFLPVVLLLLLWLAALWAGQYLTRVAGTGRHERSVRIAGAILIAVGVAGIARGAVGMTLPEYRPDDIEVMTPVGLGFGTALLIGGFWLLALSRGRDAPRPFAATQRASLLVAAIAILAALCWLTTLYGGFRGEADARITHGELWARETSVVLDTTQPLNPPQNMLAEWVLPSSGEPAKVYRYECFRVLVVRGDQWVLVPARWNQGDGYAVTITPGPSHRVTMIKHLGLAQSDAVDRGGDWPCMEVAPEDVRSSNLGDRG